MRMRLYILLVLLGLSATGCMTPTQESEWRWKQFNPEYQPAHDFDRQ